MRTVLPLWRLGRNDGIIHRPLASGRPACHTNSYFAPLTFAILLFPASFLWSQPAVLQQAAQYQNRAASYLLNGSREEAIRQLDAAANLYRSAGEWEHYFSCLNQATNVYLSTGQLDDAKRTAKKALWESIQRLGRDNDEAAKAAHRLAEVYSRAGRHAKAIEVHKMGLMIRESIYGGSHPKLADSYDCIAGAWAAAADFGQAEVYYGQALELRRSLLGAQHPDVAISFSNLASLEAARGRYAEALAHHQAALAIRRASFGSRHPEAGSSLIAMARINRLLNKPALAEEQYREAARCYRQNMDSKGAEAAEAFHYLALSSLDDGSLAAAARYARQAVKALAFSPEAESALSYQNFRSLGAVLMELGRYQEASFYLQQAIATGKGLPTADCYRQWSESLRLAGKLEESLEAAHAYLEWAGGQEERSALPDAHLQLGRVYIEAGNSEAGIRQLAQALKYEGAPYWLLQEASLALGDAYRKQGRYEQAILQYQQLSTELAQSQQAGTLFLRFRVLQALGAAHGELASQDRNALFNLEAAVHTYEDCSQLLLRLRRAPLPREQLVYLVEAQTRLFGDAIGSCLSLFQQNQDEAYLKEAFCFSERSKQLSLQLPLLLLPPTCFGRAPKELLEQEAGQRKQAQARYRARLNGPGQTALIDSLQNEAVAWETQFETTLSAMEREAPDYFRLKFGDEVVNPDELNAALKQQGAALYAYFVTESSLYIFYANGSGLQLFRRSIDEALLDGLGTFLRLILDDPSGKPSSALPELTGLAARLYGELFPVRPGEAFPRLLILPHGPLLRLPFEALMPAAPEGSNFSTLPYLGVTHELMYFSSATAWFEAWEQRSQTAYELPFTAFVSPAANGQVAMKGEYALSNNAPSSLRYFLELADDWAARGGGSLWGGPAAQEAAFRQMPSVETLLLAIPATVGSLPDNIYLSFFEEKDSIYDNRLYLKDIFGLQKRIGLCMLASSITQAGQEAGWPQLAEALRYAGCQASLIHRWPATGQPSVELLRIFMARRQEGGSLPMQLQSARREYLAAQAGAPERAHPHFWAGFLYYGLPGEAGSSPAIPGYWIMAAIATLILIGWLMKLK